ncbi:MAG TPA: neutral zinc metallopeptidase [Casimicrobiaceae bacterium]|nr:neutral zinc metallopeptidase [Casimicrobiaceae bacterium]
MRWGDMRRSENIEDRSGRSFPMGGGGMKIGLGGVIIALIASVLFGVNPLDVLVGMDQSTPQQSAPAPEPRSGPPGSPAAKSADPTKEMVARVVGDTEDVWQALFKSLGRPNYPAPNLVMFSGGVQSACGTANSAVGPFYCPADGKVYLDTSFFNQLERRFGAPGDFAQAYVVAHEIGHHVQNVLGTMRQFDQQAARMDDRRRRELQVRLELQADCYAGVWGHFAQRRKLLEPGDVEEGLRAAAAVGDDQIMKRTQGYVVPDAFTHGSAEQRVRWFRRGMETGDPRQCDTFSAQQI